MDNTTFTPETRTATNACACKTTQPVSVVSGITYLATPYTHPCKVVREERFRDANWCAAFLMKNLNLIVFSPISHSHAIATDHDIPTTWEFWKRQDEAILRKCSNMVVLMQEGWENSVGVRAEIELAHSLGIPVAYISPRSLLLMEDIADMLS